MCGIAGIYNLDGAPADIELLRRMLSLMTHRGPDDQGEYIDDALALGHRRLSIIDLSYAGHQPMCNEDGSVWITYNGEIYNYRELRANLEVHGYRFRSHTDTEVVLHAYEEYGPACLNQFNGMWALAIWDGKRRRLFCARDRFGIKPFYYVFDGRQFLLASEIKPLLAAMKLPRKPNERIIFDFLAYSMMEHTTETFFVGVNKLLQGHYLIIDEHGLCTQRYWFPQIDPTASGLSDNEVATHFYDLFVDSVKLRLQSEVPVGTCLSGGIDSSSVACVINNLLTEKSDCQTVIGPRQKTFSARFPGSPYDEGRFMMEVLKHINADPHYVYPQGKDLFDDGIKMLWHQEEPVISTSYYAQWCVMRKVKEMGVTVILDGEGPDELLGGYSVFWPSLWTELFQRGNWTQFIRELRIAKRERGWPARAILLNLLRTKVPARWIEMSRWVLRGFRKDTLALNTIPCLNKDFVRAQDHDLGIPKRWQEILTAHLYRYLSCDNLPLLLRNKDRASMSFSLEARVPFLDYRLVMFILSLPIRHKMRNGLSKVVLRRAMVDTLPEVILNRRDKIGFDTPEKEWFRTVAYEPVREILHSTSFSQRGYFDVPEVKHQFDLYMSGELSSGFSPWKFVVLELWLRMFIDNDPTKHIL
ncbi:MAG TPA: asparagine synthase (glutamine-hydrolyzing) [Candidatus Brocadiaceae bacterium]